MRKFRKWRPRMRQTRSQTRKQQQQQQQQPPPPPPPPLNKDAEAESEPVQSRDPRMLLIFLNDFTDADNEAAALLFAWALQLRPDIKGIYIAEPRHVNVGYYMTARDFGRCIGLVGKLTPPVSDEFTPLRIVLSGSVLTDEYINNPDLKADGKSLTPDEIDLLKRCKRPKNGEEEDAIKHARLVAMDYLTTMKDRCDRSFDSYIDRVCLKHLESPINLKTHYHDELIARNAEELREFKRITEIDPIDEDVIEDRREELRKWYDNALKRKRDEFGGVCPIEDLVDYGTLYDEIRSHDRTIFLGGASLTILEHIIRDEPALAKKVEYYQQGGTFDSKLNILGNPLNFALNTKAAKYVFHDEQKGKVGKLVLVSTTTTQQLEFTAKGLTELHSAVGVRAVGFFGRLDPWELISPKEKEGVSGTSKEFLSWRAEYARNTFCADDKFKGNKAVMADLVAFLICFTNAFDNYQEKVRKYVTNVNMTEESGSMVLQTKADGPIQSMMLKLSDVPDGQKAVLVEDALSLAEEAMKSFHLP